MQKLAELAPSPPWLQLSTNITCLWQLNVSISTLTPCRKLHPAFRTGYYNGISKMVKVSAYRCKFNGRPIIHSWIPVWGSQVVQFINFIPSSETFSRLGASNLSSKVPLLSSALNVMMSLLSTHFSILDMLTRFRHTARMWSQWYLRKSLEHRVRWEKVPCSAGSHHWAHVPEGLLDEVPECFQHILHEGALDQTCIKHGDTIEHYRSKV